MVSLLILNSLIQEGFAIVPQQPRKEGGIFENPKLDIQQSEVENIFDELKGFHEAFMTALTGVNPVVTFYFTWLGNLVRSRVNPSILFLSLSKTEKFVPCSAS